MALRHRPSEEYKDLQKKYLLELIDTLSHNIESLEETVKQQHELNLVLVNTLKDLRGPKRRKIPFIQCAGEGCLKQAPVGRKFCKRCRINRVDRHTHSR